MGAGLFAGGMVGWRGGEVLGEQVAHLIPGDIHDAAWIQDGFGAMGLFGCAYAGYMLAQRKPAEAVLIAAGTLAVRNASSMWPLSTMAWTDASSSTVGNHDVSDHGEGDEIAADDGDAYDGTLG
jgi:hypothetical protein